MKKKFVRLISAVLSAAMTLTAVPLSAFAEGEAHTHDGESNVITTPLDFREKTADENGVGWSWDYDTKTLTLDGVNIQATTEENMMSVVTVPDGTKIVLNGNNTIVQTNTGDSDTYVLSAVNTDTTNCDGTMTISGDGVLNAENRSTDSMARSLGGSIILNGGTVNATGTVKTNSLEIHNDGVLNANATTASFEGVAVNVSRGITVDGNGSLTAVGCANESTLNSAILLTSNFGDKISVSGNGSITVPESNKARVGIYYSGNNGDGMDAEISGGKVTAYGAKYGIYKVNLIMSGTGSVYTTGGSYAIGQTLPAIDMDELIVRGSADFKAEESAVTGEVELKDGYYEIGGADAKTVVIKPDTSPRIILGNQIGIFKTEEYKIIEDIDMTDIKLKGTVYFDITLKNMSDEEFADARGYFGGDEPDLLASIIKTDYGWVCMVCDTEFSVTYDTDNTLTIKCGDIVSNTVQVKSNANRFNKVTQGDNTNRTVFYTNTSQEEKDNYKLVSTYTVDSESISYNWYSTNSAYSADELGAAVSGSNGEFKLADNIPAGNYVLYCDITYSDGDSTETVTEKFTFTYKECAHENGYSDGKCTNCGALCDHSNIDIDTGKCNECAHQFVATISTDGNAPTGYDTLADCLDSITADTGNYVKIYQDIGDTSATATLDTIDVKHNVMIDLNGHKLNNIKLGVNKLGVNKDVTLTLTGTAGSYVTQVYVRKGGSFIIDSVANVEFDTIFVEDSARLAVNDGAKVTTEQLTVIASVNDDGTTTTSVKLATGMKLGGLTYHRQNNSGALKLGNLLDVTRQALRREDNGNYLDLYKEYGSMGYSVALTVVEHTDADHKYGSGTGKCEECGKPCEHGGDINTDTGICSICGAVVSVALYTDKNGSLKYVDTDELDSLLNEYNGSGTIKLFKDYSKPSAQYDLYGELTIDLNGRQFKIRSITPCKSGKLTIKNSGNPVMLGCNVYPTNDASYAGGTLIIDGDVVLDTSIYVYDSSTVILKAGAYPAGLYARDSKTLYDMLGEGKAFFKADGTLFNASVKEISSSETLTVKDHSHTYVDGECGCGYVCPHSDVNSETGKCNECEYQYAAVIVKDGAVASVYEENEMGAAFEAADSDANTGCTLKVYKNYAGSYTTLSRKFTLWIAEKANVGTLTVSGDITVTGSGKNNSIYGDFNVANGGKLTFDENCGAMGTVSVGAGTFDCYYSIDITLNINDASSDVILHGGAFRKICYNGGGDRANAEILTLLAENRMFMWRSGGPIDGSKTLLKDGFATTVFVIPHEGHSYDSTTGKCTICGKRCGHTDVDSKTGMCKTCQYEFVATLTVGDKVTGFDSLSDCLSKTSEDSENYVKIYKNIDDRTTINVNHTVTVDLNGHKLYYIELKVNNDNGAGNLTLTGSEDSYISQVDVCGGRTFKIDSDANINFETIFVEAGARFEVSYGANVTVNTLVVKESLKLYGRTTTSVRLATGMRIGTLMYELDRNSGSGNLLLYSLLGEGKALQYDNSGEYVDIYEKFTSKIIHDSFTVVDHYEHSYDKATGKCVCGYVCPHSDVDSKTGVCSICKYQFTAGISGVGTAKYFDNIDDAFTAALSEENSGCTLTLYKDCSLSTSATITNATVTVDVNGCSLGGEADISVNNGGVLYLKDSRKSTYYGCIDAPFSVNGGTLINGTADGGSSAADVLNLVINSAKCVEIYGGIFENVYIAHASGVALYGGRYNTICGEESNSTPVNDLLAKGYAFATLNSVTHLPESIVDGSAKTIGDGLKNVTVVAHEHRYNVETGKCPCGVCALAIFTETTQSSETYTFIESATQFKNIAENEADGVLKLTGDVDCIVKGIIINGNKTIDMNGHTLNVSVGTEEISAVAVYGNVTFENSGSSRAIINATGVYSYGMVTVNGDIEFDTFATFEDGDALINAGVFKSIYVQGRSVIEILGSGKALASESGEILNASVQQIYKAGDNIFVTAHPKHTYDDHGNCACGYKCLHDGEGQVDEDSANKVCSECGAKIYAKVTTADGKVKYFDDITEGLRYADKAENKGCVFTLVTTGGLENDITLSSGQFTITAIDDNYINAYTRKINIKGAEITVENCAFNCFVGLYSGSLTYPEGSTSVCINGISVFGGTLNISDGVSENFGANKFTISDTATDAKVTIGGGIYGEIKLGQYTFKDILASGTRLISVEYSQETDEIIATNELLYSIVSEQNTLGVDDDKDYRFVKCDHKNEDGSYAFNDSGICKYCNSEFAASVSYTVDGSAKTELFSDICDAFDKANEIGTATVTLYKDITDSERTQEITVMGNVTLELNGKTLGGRYGIARISVSDGGTLTVNGDGDMDTPIYVNENSKLVINGGGYFNSVSVKKGGNAEIGGGTIRGLSVRGNVKLSGGKFNDIEILNGNLESVLADGYAYKVDGGAWLSIAERAESVYSSLNNNDKPLSVEEAPIKSASIAWVGEEAPVIYRNGEKYLYVDITYELAVGSRGATYSDFVNGNNRIKDYNLYNKYMVHCYEIGKLAAKDGEVEYYIVLKCNGYEYKSNVLKLTLATCSHPKDSFSYENDGFVICGICDALIEAEVVDADGKSLGYADIESAIKLAQENEGSTVKLMSEGVSESVTVTGGRFTVDFNGKKVFYQFDVNGGDVTFTSSVKQADVETLISGITVNGTDAEVTIDGKIKLGSVTLTSGALAVNSAESYIKELSINGGKAVVNGARIGALNTFGGESVINYVTADSLSVNINGSGSISIVTGEFGSTTCKTGLGMAIASGSVVFGNSMNGITVYTYEAIQTMTKTDRIFVDKCVHKGEKGSYVLDGNPCPYCNEEIVATVSYTANGGEETDLFSDIYDAFDKANEVGTATVTLQKNITDDITDTIAVTGNVTLELNGKRLSQPGTDVWYSIEVTSGKLTVNGSGLIKRVAVRNSGDAEINGGTFSDFIIKDGGNAVIKGGQFYSLQVYGEGRNVGQLLADGYAYWSFIDSGIWSTIAEREKQDIANVEVKEAPIKSATATANKTVLYRNGGGARQISFKFNVKTSDGYTVSDANKVTVGLYVGDTLIRESDFGGNSSTFANASEISDTDGTVKAHLVIKLNGYEYVTNDVEFEIATCTHPYDALTTDEYDYYCCSLCDAGINAILVKTNGDKACYTDNVPEAFESAQLEENNGCTLELYRGVNRDCEITQGSFTVLFKKTGSASAVIKVSGGNVKFTGDDGCTLSKYPGSSVGYLIAVTGGTVTFDDITINDDSISVSGGKTVINGGTYNKLSVSGGTVTINSGTFSSIDVSAEGKALKDLLGENKAFATSDGKLFDASKISESDNSLTVIDHSKHEYDETGRCGCGYQCPHDDVDTKAGVCRECNTKIYAAITVKSETGTTVKYFAKLTEAFEFAAKNENKGCTLKMLRDFFDRNTDINVNGGKLTVDMNGFGVYINSFNGSGTRITIRSDSKCTFGVENGFSMDGGTVTFSGEVSVVCQNVKLNATYFSSYVETLKIDTLILEDGVLLKQLASITNANIANIDCSSEIYLYQILASGSRVDSQLYSALKANASSNFDNVRIIRCDHPDGVGRDNRCIYCNSLIAASVSYTENGAEKTEYFVKEDLGKAFAKANSVASATITMLMSSAYDTDYLPVTGDVTLIANGDNAILYNTVKVADGGKLTLRGNANIFAVIAEPGSRLTAEEATRIAYLTVNGGDVKLSGGQYDNITVKDGKIIDILGNGYAYKKTEGGAWLTLKEREVSEASGVTVAKAPIVQATLSTEINRLYRNSNANPTLKFNLALAHGSNLNDSYVSKRYGINSYVSGDIIYSSLSALVKDAKLSADEIIDKAGDSDVAEIYYVVTTDDGYEIKSNTVSIDLVDCDHSQVVDPTAVEGNGGNITKPTYCEICESKFNAKITKGDDVRYYNDLDEAAKDAQKSENEGCTLYPLYNKNGYGGQLVITEGNFTLKYAVRTAFSRPIIINGKAKLTVTGRCAVTAFENQDAFIVRGGDVTFDGLATGSNVTINGGNVTMAANNINCLTINGGNVSISSGGFAEIVTTVSDKVIADYIDHGFWVQDRGTKEWIDIYSLNKATASSTSGLTVRVCPMQIIQPRNNVYYTNGYYPGDIPSLQISAVPWYSGEVNADVAYQWIAIDENGNETEIEGATDRKLSLENLTTGRYYCRLTYSNAATAGVSMKSDVVTATITECEHSGGEATCTKKAKCEICGAEYGEPLGHDYVVIKVVEPDYRNEGYSVFECTRCKDSYIGNRVPVKPIPDVEEIAVEKTTYNEVDISWKNISGVDGYYVECYVGNQWKQIGFSTDGDRVAAKLSGLSAGLKYKVRIAAYAGSFTGKFRCFYVDTIPSPVWNINTVKATDETVRISWNRNTRADGYKVEWYIDNQWSAKTVTGNNNIAAVIDGLCAGTRYKVRVSAYKGNFYSPYTYGYIDTLPSKVTGITQAVTSSSFTLTWDKNESADGYTVQYYADGKWNEKTLTGNNKTTVTIGSLKGYKTYKVRIKAYKGELQSAFDDIYITTAPTKVSGLKVKSAVDSKAVVIWNADANADGYNVGYYIGGKWVEKTITDNKTAMAELDGLTPYSTYKVRVRAYKDNLYGDYSYTTVTAVLSPVTDIKVVSAKSNSITVKWGKNASADGYKVEIYKGGKWVKKTLKGSANATVTIGGLRAGSVYKVRIASYKGANTSTYTYANVNTAK